MRTATAAITFVTFLFISFPNAEAQYHCIDSENMENLLLFGTIRDISSLEPEPGVGYPGSIEGMYAIDPYRNQTVAIATVANMGSNGFVSQLCRDDKLDVTAEFKILEYSIP